LNFREIMSGQKRGVIASGLRGLLACAEPVYAAAVSRRNRRFDAGGKAVHRVPATVVSVGNITTGGTGKTPLVAWLGNWFARHTLRTAIVSRGYGAKPGEENDEALELASRLPTTPHIQNADRVTGAHQAIAQSKSQLLLLDDAFQHRRIHRDLDIVLIDALEPFGYGHLLPRGLLREPVASLRRAHVIALSRADLVTAEQRADILAIVRQHAPSATWIEIAHRPSCLVSKTLEQPIDELRGKRVAAFCGIGNPVGFRQTLEQLDVTVCDFFEFADHHRYTEKDFRALAERFDRLDVDLVLCTMKDLVKLHVDTIGRHDVRALRIDIEILSGRAEFESQLSALVAGERDE
jgi:tetraacyldisaccharide 4'-kinase